jgi:hypothetical protein
LLLLPETLFLCPYAGPTYFIVLTIVHADGTSILSLHTLLTKQTLKLYKGLWKAESAQLTQAGIRKIGLAKLLYKQSVPCITTTTCLCRAGQETLRHIALYCLYEAGRRRYLHTGQRRTYPQMIGTNEGARHFVRWMMFLERLGQFPLAKRLLFDSE